MSMKFAAGNADLYSEWISNIITWELLIENVPFFSATAFCIIDDKVWDLPDPVEPTMATCLLKNLFPLTGILIFGFVFIHI